MADADSIAIPARTKDLTGHPPFGRLTVVAYAGSTRSSSQWRCECECGETIVVLRSNLMNGATTSCGCFRRESVAARSTTHGLSSATEYHSWQAMLKRSGNPNDPAYDRYGGRGITVCDRWRNSFEAFYEDMGDKPSPRHSVERRENSGNYEPGNCYWATPEQQNRNRRNNLLLTHDGRTQCAAAWAEELKMRASTLYGRLKNGWSVERALTEPVH